MVTSNTEQKSLILMFIKAVFISVICSLLLILVFALVLRFTNLSDSFISPVNLVIKGISIAVGTIVFTKSNRGGLLKGLILGVVFTLIAYIIFSLMLGSFTFGMGFIIDCVFGGVCGAIVGVIVVNLRRI